MIARPDRLDGIRSRLAEEVLDSLDALAALAVELPAYSPKNPRGSAAGTTPFGAVHQLVQVFEDRPEWERSPAEKREWDRAAGLEPDPVASARAAASEAGVTVRPLWLRRTGARPAHSASTGLDHERAGVTD